LTSHLKGQDLTINCPANVEIERAATERDFPNISFDIFTQAFFEDWIAGFNYSHVNASCTVTETDLSGFSLPALSGGTTNITYRVTDSCGNEESCTASFTLIGDPSTTIILNCPEDFVLEDCSSQAKVDSAFNAWKAQFTFIAPPGSDLVATNLSVERAPNCGSSKTITFIVEDRSNPAIAPVECSRTFVLPPAPLINPLEGIPTMGEWGVIALILILLSIAVVSMKSRRPTAIPS